MVRVKIVCVCGWVCARVCVPRTLVDGFSDAAIKIPALVRLN